MDALTSRRIGNASAGADERARRRERHRAEVAAGILGHARRLRWPAERIDDERQRALRALLSVARERSVFHARRLPDVDPEEFTEDQLSELPTMSKQDMMDSFSEVVTDPRLTSEIVDGHLALVDSGGDDYLFGRYRVIVTSGSSGRRGTYVYDWPEWTTLALMASRSRIGMPDGNPRPPGAATMCLLGMGEGTLSSGMSSFLGDPDDPIRRLPMTMPLPQLVEALNTAQPVLVQAYPSALDLLVNETRAGRLGIAPRYLESGGELLTERTRDDVREIWGTEIEDCWGLSEGIFAYGCPARRAIHLPDDLVIVEPADVKGNLVAPGQPAEKLFITNLYNHTQPLIRFEIPDGLTLFEGTCECGSAHRRVERLIGRHDQTFDYAGGVRVYPMGLGLEIEEEPGLIEYQLRQTRRGLVVRAVVEPTAVSENLGHRVHGMLVDSGLTDPEVVVEVVDHIDRLPSGKLRQFVALSAG